MDVRRSGLGRRLGTLALAGANEVGGAAVEPTAGTLSRSANGSSSTTGDVAGTLISTSGAAMCTVARQDGHRNVETPGVAGRRIFELHEGHVTMLGSVLEFDGEVLLGATRVVGF